jgi:hypothetical protein
LAYEELLTREAESRKAAFNLESAWISYAVLEDRLNSLLRLTGGIPTDRKKKPIRMLGKKLKAAIDRLGSDAELRKATGKGSDLNAIGSWKDRRDSLMHSMANDGRSWADLAAEASALSSDGRDVVRAASSAVMRLKKLKKA